METSKTITTFRRPQHDVCMYLLPPPPIPKKTCYAPYVRSTTDMHDFSRFCAIFINEISLHHVLEDHTIFPMWVEATGDAHIMDGSIGPRSDFVQLHACLVYAELWRH